MKCPNCQSELGRAEFRNIEINECLHCQGRWFDRDELQKAKNNTDEDLRWIDFDPFRKSEKHFHPVSGGEGGLCPRCDQRMSLLTYVSSGVVIEKCELCRGIWLQEGEFRRIISFLEDLVTSRTAARYVIDSFKQLLQIVSGPENKISEVKDFLLVLKLLKLRASVEHSKLAQLTEVIYQYLPFL